MRWGLILVFVLIVQSGFCQQFEKETSVYIQGGIGLPTGMFSSIYKLTLNGKVGLQYDISPKTNLVAETGYMYFFKKNKPGGISFIPLTGGIEYEAAPDTHASIQIGGALLADRPVQIYFAVQPGVAYNFTEHTSLKLDYTGFVSYGYVVGGLNLSYRYRL